jgi:hypothetical protein
MRKRFRLVAVSFFIFCNVCLLYPQQKTPTQVVEDLNAKARPSSSASAQPTLAPARKMALRMMARVKLQILFTYALAATASCISMVSTLLLSAT